MKHATEFFAGIRQAGSFTLLELLASMAILVVLVGLLFAAFTQTNKAWLQGESRVETFVQARAALDFISKELSQALVTTNVPFAANYDSLAFIAPVSDDVNDRVDLVEVAYRLSWYVSTAGNDPNGVFVDHVGQWPKKLVRRSATFTSTSGWSYGQGSSTTTPWDFYTNPDWPETASSNRTAILAENVVSINFEFRDSDLVKTDYWNSASTPAWSHELQGPLAAGVANMIGRTPTGIQITLGVVDSRSANVLRSGLTNTPVAWSNALNRVTQYFTTYVTPGGR